MEEIHPEEDSAWAEVEARWEEAGAHQAYLARFSDLEGLTSAGRRYKQALDRRPGDPVALRGRDEVLKRATALALAQLPRTRPPSTWGMPRWLRSLLVAAAIALFVGVVATLAWQLALALRAAAPGKAF
jgi:hypothetical protein